MPKKLIVTTKEEIAPPPPPPPPEPEPEPEDDDEISDPVFNAATQTIERMTVIPMVEGRVAPPATAATQDEEWLAQEFTGQLAVDVYQTDKDIVIRSVIAGVLSDDLDIQVTNDMVTIKGVRRIEEEVPDESYFTRECYWGRFSRSIILPVDVRNDRVDATIKNGILTIRLPKIEPQKVTVVSVE